MDGKETVTVTVETGLTDATVTLRETARGAGDWSVVGVELQAPDGSGLTADGLRNYAWAGLLDAARKQAQKARRTAVLTRPSDPPAAFRVDRRGKSSRTDRDYAELAASYLAFPADRRHKAATEWAERFERASPQRWRADLRQAKRYVESVPTGEVDRKGDPVTELCLTDEGMRLVYGEDIFDQLQREAEVDNAEEWITLLDGAAFGSGKRARVDNDVLRIAGKNGWRPDDVRSAWRRQNQEKVDSFYPPLGE